MRLKRHLLRFVLGVVRRPKLTLLLAGLLLAASVTIAMTRLTISADSNKLFDPSVPFFRDYLKFNENFPENEAVYVVVRPADDAQQPPVPRWTALADAIAAKVGTLTDAVQGVDARIPIDQLGPQGLLFDTPTRIRVSVDGVREFIPLIKAVVEKGFWKSVVLGGTPLERLMSAMDRAPADADTNKFIAMLADSWQYTVAHDGTLRPGAGLPEFASLDADDPSRLGYYYVRDQVDPKQHLLLVRVAPKTDYASLTAVSETIEKINAAVDAAAKDYPEFKVALTGRPALDADEMRTTDRDTRKAEILAASAVFLGLVVVLRSFWLAVAGELTLAVGVGWTFAWATLTVGQLNLLSIVFLLALIGIGMDYLVQILTRYRVEADRRRDPRRIWVAVFRHVSAPINTACLGAAGAFGVSALTQFRGAAELGIVAGGGLLLCLAAGYVVLPPLLTLLPVKRAKVPPAVAVVRPPSGRWRHFVTPVLWIGLLAAGLPYALRPRFNPDILGLQAPDHESVRLIKHLQTWSIAVVSKDLDVLRKVEAAVVELPTVRTTESVLSAFDNLDDLQRMGATLPTVAFAEPKAVTPGTLSSLARNAWALAKKVGPTDGDLSDRLTHLANALSVRDDADRGRLASRLNDWQNGFLRQLKENLDTFHPTGLDVATLPTELRSHYLGRDGQYALYVYPNADLWDQVNLNAFARQVAARVATVPGAPAPTGIVPNIAGTTAGIERAFYQATVYALVLIALLVLLDLRHVGHTLLAVSVLAFGLPMLTVIMGLLRVDWNFANFFALPILIGAGHEYGVFLVHRYLEARDYPSRIWGRWDVSDKALALCAYVTCSSFGFFWLTASHLGLRSLGLVMTVGTACIYLAGLLVLRPVLKWKLARTHCAATSPTGNAVATRQRATASHRRGIRDHRGFPTEPQAQQPRRPLHGQVRDQ